MKPETAPTPRRRYLFLAFRVIIAVALLIWVWNRLQKQGAGDVSLRGMDGGWLTAAFALGGVSVLGWAGRWWWFLRVYGLRAKYSELLRLTLFADFFNLYFLGPLGADGIRLLLLSRTFPERRGAIVGSLILDHFGGLFGGAILYLLFSRQIALPQAVQSSADIGLILFVGTCFLGVGVLMESWVQRIVARIPGLKKLSTKFSVLYAPPMRQPWLLAGCIVSSLGTACAYAAYWAAARALGADVTLTGMFGLMPLVDVIASLPITISGIGIREGLLVEWLGDQEGIGAAKALAISLLGFAALGLWGLIGGLWLAAWRRKDHPHTTA
ncbi:lysylphosphatidylglycerol synthase transmembrane domain-containing protein [Prosthecobacter sp. SYSU 5D2]|uniref:lysylphosphatidylglycerol synthase transmembrane domain-containing protein n=1 Tax=Prosthecobacter sp. SYSU 5D2 TaxID=3134134 RepID=UPI0031FE4982